MQANEALMPTDLLKISYVQNRTSGNAFAQLKPRLRADVMRPFASVNKMFEAFGMAL